MKICVFASSCEVGAEVSNAVYALGKKLGSEGHTLVYGGYTKGLMGDIARGFHDGGAEIVGVIPVCFDSEEMNFPHLTETVHTRDLSERKDAMIRMSDAFIAVPGGIGTLDEMFSLMAQKASKLLDKEIVFYNVGGFFDPLLEFLQTMERDGYLYAELRNLYRVETPASLGLE